MTLTSRVSDSRNEQPLDGVSCIRLESIHFSFEFSTCRPRGIILDTSYQNSISSESQRQNGPWDISIHSIEIAQDSERLEQVEDIILDELQPESVLKGSRISSRGSLGETMSTMLEAEEALLSNRDKKLAILASHERINALDFGEGGRLLSWTATAPFGITTNSDLAHYWISAISNLHTDVHLGGTSDSIADYFRQYFELEGVRRVLDASLRFIMCDRRSIRSTGIFLSKYSGFPAMSTIAPALFSPGFSQVWTPAFGQVSICADQPFP